MTQTATRPAISPYKSQAARDAQHGKYGEESYWEYLDRSAQEHYDYYAARGDMENAQSQFTMTLSEALAGNNGD